MIPCPVCNSPHPSPFLHRPNVPVHQNLLVATAEAARNGTRGDLDLVVCENCGFVFNQAFDLSILAYGENYDNTQSCSPFFEAYLDGLVRDLVEKQGVRDCTIVEVGCGKGEFLRKLVNYPGANNRGFGFDPSYRGPAEEGNLRFRTCYYDASCVDVKADVVVCRHVIEHVPEPRNLLASVRGALVGSPRVFFETPCVEWILKNRVVWDFFYEHCSLFTVGSLRRAFEEEGFLVDGVRHLFGGQYLWLEAHLGETEKREGRPETAKMARAYGAELAMSMTRWRERLEALEGPIAIWGAGAKGATFANLMDPECRIFSCVVDLNPNKQGRFIPGTGHPIVGPDNLAGIRYALLMNPNYREENLRLLAEKGIQMELLDWD